MAITFKISVKKSLRMVISTVAGTVMALASYLPAQAAAPPPIALVIGGEGGTVWNFTNIKPGDSGTKIISLQNIGTTDGLVTIWLSHVVNTRAAGVDPKFAGWPGELSEFLKINASCRGLEANLVLPTALNNFPQTSSGPYYVRIKPVRAGETVSLTWKWELPAQIGNEVQGKGASFTINYVLEELPPLQPPSESEPAIALPPNPPVPATPANPAPANPPEPTPAAPEAQPPVAAPPVTPLPAPATPAPNVPPDVSAPEIPTVTSPDANVPSLDVLMENSRYSLKTDANGIVQEAVELSDKAHNFIIDIARGTRVTGTEGKPLDRLELAEVPESVSAFVAVPPGMVPVGPVYTIVGYSDGKQVPHVNFEPYVIFSLRYDPNKLPANAREPFIVNFVKEGGLVRLGLPAGSIFESGKAKGMAYHASYFSLMAEVVPPPAPLPAQFRLSSLNVKPVLAAPGQTITISVDIANDGATGGTYELHLVIDGVVRAIKDVRLEPNTVSTLTFEVADLAPGRHQVNVAGLSGEFRIVDAEAGITGSPIDWTVVDLSVAGALMSGLLLTMLIVKRMQRNDNANK